MTPIDKLHSEQIGTMLSTVTKPPFFSEMICPPIKDLELIDNKHESSFRYMNTGACVGETSIVIEFLEKCQKWMGEKINDTVAGRLAQQEMSDKVVVDRNCELMVCLYDVNESEVVVYE